MIINLEVVEKAMLLAFEHLRKNEISQMEIMNELYWDIPLKEFQNMGLSNILPEVGNMMDDYHDLVRIVDGEQPPLAYHLVTASALLRCIGSDLSKALAPDGG